MATIGGRMPSRETALTMIAQVERQAGVIARRHASDDNILDRFTDFRNFIDQLAEFHLFIDMVENRLGGFEPEARAAQVRKLCVIRWGVLEIELEVTSQFLDRMATGGKPWPMGSQKFQRRRLTRLDDIASFHAAHGEAYELAPPNAGLMQNIRDRVEAQIDHSVPLADFGSAPAAEMSPEPEAPLAAMPEPEVRPAPVPEPPAAPEPPPAEPIIEIPKVSEPRPATPPVAPPPPVPSQPEVMIPGMMSFAPSAPKAAPSSSEPTAAPIPKPAAPAPAMPGFVIPGMMLPEAPPPPPPSPTQPPASSAPEPSPPRPVSELPPVPPLEGEDFGADYVSQKAKAVARMAEKAAAKPGAKPGAPAGAKPGLARRDFRLKVRDDADGYHYIEGNGLAVITESCRLANTTIDELAKNLELSRPGLVLILNGRDPCSTELLKVLRRFVLRTGGLV